MPPLLPPAGPPVSVSMTMCLRATALLPQLRPHSRWEEGSSLLDLSDPRAAGAPLPWQPAQHMCVLGGLSQSPAATGNPVPSSPPSSARALGSQANCGLLLLSSVLESERPELSLLTCSVIWAKRLTAQSLGLLPCKTGGAGFVVRTHAEVATKGLVPGDSSWTPLQPGDLSPLQGRLHPWEPPFGKFSHLDPSWMRREPSLALPVFLSNLHPTAHRPWGSRGLLVAGGTDGAWSCPVPSDGISPPSQRAAFRTQALFLSLSEGQGRGQHLLVLCF